jgi:hypothetical protein
MQKLRNILPWLPWLQLIWHNCTLFTSQYLSQKQLESDDNCAQTSFLLLGQTREWSRIWSRIWSQSKCSVATGVVQRLLQIVLFLSWFETSDFPPPPTNRKPKSWREQVLQISRTHFSRYWGTDPFRLFACEGSRASILSFWAFHRTRSSRCRCRCAEYLSESLLQNYVFEVQVRGDIKQAYVETSSYFRGHIAPSTSWNYSLDFVCC